MSFRSLCRVRVTGAAAVVAFAGVIALGASPVHAKNEFEDGFKDEAGRIAAHAAAGAAVAVFGGIIHGPPGHGYRHHGPPHGYRGYGYYRRPKVVYHYHEHYYPAPCGVRYYYDDDDDDDGGYYHRGYERYERYERGGHEHAGHEWDD